MVSSDRLRRRRAPAHVFYFTFYLLLLGYHVQVFAWVPLLHRALQRLRVEWRRRPPTQKIHLFNWNHHDLDTLAFDPMGAAARNSIGVTDEDHCPDGWIRFSKSCYYIEQEMMGFAKAEKRCFEKDATLFVANSLDEWDAIRHHTPKAFFAWIGLVRFSSYEKSEALPRWQTEGGINPAKLNWVIRPYSPMPNGWSSVSNCAASYNAAVAIDSASYVYYYPCVSSFHSICERNATLIDLARNNAQFV